MEEFEKDQPDNDETRQLADTRKLTLTPLHADVQPDEQPEYDAFSSARATQTQENLSTDSEDTARPEQLIQPARQDLMEKTIMQPAPPRKRHIGIIITMIVVVLLGVAAFWFIQQNR